MLEDGVFVWNPEFFKHQMRDTFLLIGVIFLVIAICCFNVWPLSVKLGLWYLSVILLVLILGLLIARFVFWLLFKCFGYTFWLFPRLNDPSAGFFESFVPLYEFELEKIDLKWKTVRFCTLIIICCLIVQLGYIDYQELLSYKVTVTDAIFDFVEWGEHKVAGNFTGGIRLYRNPTFDKDIPIH